MLRTPERPASIASQVEATSPPTGVVAPSPVMTTSIGVVVMRAVLQGPGSRCGYWFFAM